MSDTKSRFGLKCGRPVWLSRLVTTGIAAFVLLAILQFVVAQKPIAANAGIAFGASDAKSDDFNKSGQETRIRMIIPSIVEVERKLKWLIESSPDQKLRKQWRRLKEDLIDAFTEGVDAAQPVAVDIIVFPDGLDFEFRIPISDVTDARNRFLDGLRGRSYVVKEIGSGAYTIGVKGRKRSHLYFDQKYAWIVTGERPLSMNPPPATVNLMPILTSNKDQDVMALLKNDANGISLRQANFQSFREHLETSYQIRPTEGRESYELRRMSLNLMLSEAERFLVQADRFKMNWIVSTESPKKFGRGEVSLTALPDTGLSNSIGELARQPSHFANLTWHPNSVAFTKLTIPLDATSIRNLKRYCDLARPILKTEINPQLSDGVGQRNLQAGAMNLFVEMLDSASTLRLADGYVDLFQTTSNKNVLLWGVSVTDDKRANEILKSIHSFQPKWQLKNLVDEHTGVGIHQLTIAREDLPLFQTVFEGESTVYFGTGPTAFWVAAGSDSLKYLKAAIDDSIRSSPPKIDSVFFNHRLQVGKLASLYGMIRRRLSAGSSPATLEQRRKKKDVDKYLKLANDAFSQCEPLVFGDLRRVDNKIEGYTEMNECMLTCLGSILGDIAKDLP